MISKDLFTKRQVHLDFHTSPDIEGIGKNFDKKKFQDALRLGKINSITVFAKCHHGMCYYPTKVGKMHPHLDFDLTGAMVDAAHEIGVRAPIYITAGWSDHDAKSHPDWIARSEDGSEITSDNYEPLTDPEAPKLHCAWQTLCLNDGGEYTRHIYALTEEICKRYKKVDGLFYDICIVGGLQCYCPSCMRGMKEEGVDIADVNAVSAYFTRKRRAFMEKCGAIMRRYHPEATIFFNSGGADQYKPEYHSLQTHYEMEDLPTAWGGYNKLSMRAKFFSTTGKPSLAMTGKFHLDWGEFGGFKPKEALKYEIALMALYGVGASVGDHLHPDGEPEFETYASIGYAYDYLEKISPYCYGGKGIANLGVFPSHLKMANEGISNILSENQIDYEVITGNEFAKFDTVIFSEGARLDENGKAALEEYIKNGGNVMIMADALVENGRFAIDFGVFYEGDAEYDCDYIIPRISREELPDAPMLCNIPAHRVSCNEGEIMADMITPYFSRTIGHFCGHKNTPHNKNSQKHPAIIKKGNIVYTAHSLARQYYEFGSVYSKRYFMQALCSVYSGSPVKVEGLYSEGRIRTIKQAESNRYCINLTYAASSKRGAAEIIEDILPLYEIKITAELPESIKRIYLPLSDKELDFTVSDGKIKFTLPKLLCHETIVLEY